MTDAYEWIQEGDPPLLATGSAGTGIPIVSLIDAHEIKSSKDTAKRFGITTTQVDEDFSKASKILSLLEKQFSDS